MLIPGLGHGSYLCVGVTSDVIVQNSIDISSNKTTCKYVFIMLLAHFILKIIIPYHLYENQMSIKYYYQIREPCYQCWWLPGHSWDLAALLQHSSFRHLDQRSQWSLAEHLQSILH